MLKRLALRLLLIAATFWGGGIASSSVLPMPFSAVMLERQVSTWLSGDVRYLAHSDWVGMDEISPWMGLAVITAEDQELPEHWGFDISAIEKALARNERHDTRTRGVSTLSQQTMEDLFLWNGRSWLHKGPEVGSTVGTETVWSKKRILIIYLNATEPGDRTPGVKAVAQRYFHKPADQLTPREAAPLVAVLPNPVRYRADTPSGYVRDRQTWILRQMRQLGGEGFTYEHKSHQRVNPAPGLALPLVSRRREV